jgi:hypothetical protein
MWAGSNMEAMRREGSRPGQANTLAVSSEEEAVQMDIPSKVDWEYTYHLIDNGTEVERFRCLLVEAEKNAVDSHDPLKIR